MCYAFEFLLGGEGRTQIFISNKQVQPWSWLETKQKHTNTADIFELLWLNVFAGVNVKQCELKWKWENGYKPRIWDLYVIFT